MASVSRTDSLPASRKAALVGTDRIETCGDDEQSGQRSYFARFYPCWRGANTELPWPAAKIAIKHCEEMGPTVSFRTNAERVTVWRQIDIARKDLFMRLFASKSDDDTNDKEVESPYYQPEETGVPAENEAEQGVREDYNTEKEDPDSDPIPDEPPDWASDLPSPKV